MEEWNIKEDKVLLPDQEKRSERVWQPKRGAAGRDVWLQREDWQKAAAFCLFQKGQGSLDLNNIVLFLIFGFRWVDRLREGA